MADRSIRDFQAPFAVAPIADAWASGNGFALSQVEPDGSRIYVRGSGLLTGRMFCIVRQFNEHVRIEAYVKATMFPMESSVEPGIVGGLPRKMCREAVDRLLAQLGQPPISAADNGARTISAAPATGPGYRSSDTRTPAVSLLAIADVVTAVVCVGVAADYWRAFNWRANYDEMNWAAFDLLMVAGYLALVGGGIAVAWRLWSMRPDAWLAAIQLAVGLIALTVLSGLVWGFEPIGFVGIAVQTAILVYLNTAAIRGLFGRPPMKTYQA